MPFEPAFKDYASGDLIYGWNMHRSFFTSAQGATKPRWMEDFSTPLESSSDFGKQLQSGHAKYGKVVDQTTRYTNKDTTQKCKGGLWWATQVEHKHVHFYLGGLDMDMVIRKTDEGITCAELRWVYRYKDNADVKSYIQFWRPKNCTSLAGLKTSAAKPSDGYEQCYPPWDLRFGDSHADKTWSTYKPKGAHHINGTTV